MLRAKLLVITPLLLEAINRLLHVMNLLSIALLGFAALLLDAVDGVLHAVDLLRAIILELAMLLLLNYNMIGGECDSQEDK